MSVPRDMKWWHESVIDWMLLNPGKHIRDAAPHFNVSENYMYLLTESDMFKSRFAERRKELIGEVHRSTIERAKGLGDACIDLLSDRIAREREVIALSEVRETAELALRVAGYGVGSGRNGTQPTAVQVNIITSEDLARARELMRQRRAITVEQDDEPAVATAGI